MKKGASALEQYRKRERNGVLTSDSRCNVVHGGRCNVNIGKAFVVSFRLRSNG